ncbi:MAG: bifunctional phosphopantothenoylcysteine decarboxylase/phosphopantothenate--cysteine ligase CoaBC [Bacteroidales bacterium]|jgi:phosphopantothenoylcysteine decarboxylase/phosphopantothenate--cysteine ligase|nr:bifunctional phosphopantothenoylcysteine decarboxylase/phosphopantothenate--cysteine ligase CoaBC [Bacteroidales bacterium]
MLKGKNIILGITGSIAAYKAAILVRSLVKEGADVKVIMTPLAKEFISPLTLATLCKNPILVDFFNPENGDWNSHVDLGLWADLYLIAPASANTMGKMAHGIADNLLLTTYLSAKCPVMVAPAMDLDMYQHPATLKNIEILKSYGNTIVEATSGELASGLIGKGRMEEPEVITEKIKLFFAQQEGEKKKLSNKNVLITAGPTYEQIDPVRFIGNNSTGKMGFAIAEELAERGAIVNMVCGPTAEKASHKNIIVHNVVSADDMLKKSVELFDNSDISIMTAAVADFTPVSKDFQKVKRGKENWTIELKPTADIAKTLGESKKDNQVMVGFALETQNEEYNAKDKLTRKNLDFIVLNSLNDKGAGFGYNTNKITIIDNQNNIQKFELKTKREVAGDIADKILTYFEE